MDWQWDHWRGDCWAERWGPCWEWTQRDFHWESCWDQSWDLQLEPWWVIHWGTQRAVPGEALLGHCWESHWDWQMAERWENLRETSWDCLRVQHWGLPGEQNWGMLRGHPRELHWECPPEDRWEFHWEPD